MSTSDPASEADQAPESHALRNRLAQIVREHAEPHYDYGGCRDGEAVPVKVLLALLDETSVSPTGQVMPEPHVEWAVEVTWRDWKKAGAKGPTSQYGPFDTEESRDRFLDAQRRDRDVTATRTLPRLASYTAWDDTAEVPEPTSEEDRTRRLARHYEEMGLGHVLGSS